MVSGGGRGSCCKRVVLCVNGLWILNECSFVSSSPVVGGRTLFVCCWSRFLCISLSIEEEGEVEVSPRSYLSILPSSPLPCLLPL